MRPEGATATAKDGSMSFRPLIAYAAKLAILALIAGCAPAVATKPPENYRGPIAEAPSVEPTYFWRFEAGDGKKYLTRPTSALKDVSFPLWLGKTWEYETLRNRTRGESPAAGTPVPMDVECRVASFGSVTVPAGTFDAFECRCDCSERLSILTRYDGSCGSWTFWYSPAAKNYVKVSAESPADSLQLVEYSITGPPKPRPDASTADELYTRANIYLDQKDYDRAIADFDRVIALRPGYASAHYGRGVAYLAKKDDARALVDYDQAIRLDPSYTAAFNSRGNLLYDKREYERAFADFNRALESSPNLPSALHGRGNVHYQRRNFDRAIKDYDEAIRLHPKYAAAFNSRAAAFRAKGEYVRALADYEAAARIDPKSVQERSIGATLFYLGRIAESANALERRLAAAPEDAYAMLWRYITAAREMGIGAAVKELNENAGKLKESRWPAPVIGFYLGKLDEKALYAAAGDSDPKTKAEQICEAHFYSAEAKLLQKATEAALPLLRAAERECPPTFYEAHGARAELARLGKR